MIKVTINGTPHYCPSHAGEAQLWFYERVRKIEQDRIEIMDLAAILLGTEKASIERMSMGEIGKLYAVANSVMAWMPDWIRQMEKAPVPRHFKIGDREYKRPKSWVGHQYRAHIYLEQYLASQSPTLVRDVVALYMIEEVIGPGWNDDDLLHLAAFVDTMPAMEACPLFFYACRSLETTKPKYLAQFIGQLLSSKLNTLATWVRSPWSTT
jgi:hypothetical protein